MFTSATVSHDYGGQFERPTSSTVDTQAYSESAFEFMAKESPYELLHLIEFGRLSELQLTFAAECAGRADLKRLVAATVLPLLRHPSALVREGAIYGLELLQDQLGVRDAIVLHSLVEHEPSRGVRDAARDALELK